MGPDCLIEAVLLTTCNIYFLQGYEDEKFSYFFRKIYDEAALMPTHKICFFWRNENIIKGVQQKNCNIVIRVAEWLGLMTADHTVLGVNPAGGVKH